MRLLYGYPGSPDNGAINDHLDDDRIAEINAELLRAFGPRMMTREQMLAGFAALDVLKPGQGPVFVIDSASAGVVE